MDPIPVVDDPLFWSRVAKSDSCWVYGRSKTTDSYRMVVRPVGAKRRQRGAHVYSWELHFGTIPDGMYVCHKCDNPPCIRPTHLFLGTPGANIQDMLHKGRGNKVSGEKHYLSKLDALAVVKIREMASTMSTKDLGKLFGVTRQTVRDVVAGRTWKSIE